MAKSNFDLFSDVVRNKQAFNWEGDILYLPNTQKVKKLIEKHELPLNLKTYSFFASSPYAYEMWGEMPITEIAKVSIAIDPNCTFEVDYAHQEDKLRVAIRRARRNLSKNFNFAELQAAIASEIEIMEKRRFQKMMEFTYRNMHK